MSDENGAKSTQKSYFAGSSAAGGIAQVFPSTAMIPNVLRAVMQSRAAAPLDVSTVEAYCARIIEAARLLEKFSLAQEPPADRAESFHYLLMLMAYTVDASVVCVDPLEPMWSQPYKHNLLDIGSACPDGVYRRVMLRDDKVYRVHGRFGNADYFSMDFRQSRPAVTVMPDDADLDVDADGNFELLIGGEPRERNWRPLHKGVTGLVVREYFHDWCAARRSLLRIECLGAETAPRPEHQSNYVAAEFDVLSDWILEAGVRYWIDQSEALAKGGANAFLPKLNRVEGKLPVTTFGLWDLAPDEGLMIEFTDPQAAFWAFQLSTSLWRTIDFANRLSTSNPAHAHRDEDGVYRFVLSGRDPEIYNWLDTTGLARGIVIVRFCSAKHPNAPRARKIKLSALASELPNAKPCTPAERRVQIAQRREGVAHMICD